jgi:hypothetical protein
MSAISPQVPLYASAARTATPTAAEFSADGYHGLHLVIDVTAVTATPSVVPTVDFYDDLSGKWCNLLSGTALTATGTTVLKIYPGLAPVAAGAASDCVHGRMRLVCTHGDSDSVTYTAAAHLIG